MKLTKLQQRRFRQICDALTILIEDVRKKIPEANLYIEGDGDFNILCGDSHDEGNKARQDRVLASHYVPYFGGGGW